MKRTLFILLICFVLGIFVGCSYIVPDSAIEPETNHEVLITETPSETLTAAFTTEPTKDPEVPSKTPYTAPAATPTAPPVTYEPTPTVTASPTPLPTPTGTNTPTPSVTATPSPETSQEATPTPHVCDFRVSSRTEPTYTEPGVILYVCDCGKLLTEVIPKLTCAHSHLSTDIRQATCTSPGLKTTTCTECGYTVTETLAATGHNYTLKTSQPPICDNAGYKIFRCSRCGDEYTETLPALGNHHFVYDSTIKEPTASEPGIMKLKCTRCGKETTDSIPVVTKKINLDEKHPYDVFASMPEPARQVIYDILAAYERNKDLYSPEDHTNDLIYAPIPDGDWDYDFVSSTKTALFLAYGISYDDWDLTYAVSVPKPVNHPKPYILRSNTVIPVSAIPDNGIVYMYYEGLVKWTEIYHDNQAQVRAILEQMNDGTDLDIVQQIFAYCDEHFTYDASVATLSDLLKLKRGSCNAMSSFVRMACAMCGIKVDQIIGFNDDYTYYHAWNRIWLNGQWTFWDATNIRKRNLKTMSGVHPKALNRLFPSIEEAASMPDIDMFQ